MFRIETVGRTSRQSLKPRDFANDRLNPEFKNELANWAKCLKIILTRMDHEAGNTARVENQTVRPLIATPPVEPGAPTDFDLMHRIQAEDAEALSELYDRYNGILKALILRVIHNETEADDLLQEIFMEIWNQAKNFSAQKGKPLGWMVTLARRRAIDGLRKKQAYARAEERLQSQTEQQPDAWVHNATEEEIAFSDTRILVREVIARLPPAQQEAIDLAFFRGMSQREIAAKTNTPLGTVKTRLELGLKKIYDGLKELKDEL
jgi:RNA polymerase sigma-70 factor (ECF subfamily)